MRANRILKPYKRSKVSKAGFIQHYENEVMAKEAKQTISSPTVFRFIKKNT